MRSEFPLAIEFEFALHVDIGGGVPLVWVDLWKVQVQTLFVVSSHRGVERSRFDATTNDPNAQDFRIASWFAHIRKSLVYLILFGSLWAQTSFYCWFLNVWSIQAFVQVLCFCLAQVSRHSVFGLFYLLGYLFSLGGSLILEGDIVSWRRTIILRGPNGTYVVFAVVRFQLCDSVFLRALFIWRINFVNLTNTVQAW